MRLSSLPGFRLLSLRALMLLALGSVPSLLPLSFAATATWTGLGADGDWLTNANWQSSTLPYSGSEGHNLMFGASPQTALTISQGVSIGSMTFSVAAPAYTMTFSLEPGWSSSFDNGITNNSALQQTLIAAGSPLNFWDGSITGDVKLIARDGPNGVALLTFNDQASAGSSTIVNEKSASSGYGNATEFWGNASAGNSTIINEAAADAATAGGYTQFYESSTAGSSTITNGAGASVTFRDTSSAGSSHVTAYGGQNGAASGAIIFQNNADAGSATLVADGTGDTDTAMIYFSGDSTGGTSRIILKNGGSLDVANRSGGTVTIGSIEGDSASSYINISKSKGLIVGSNNLDTTFAGIFNGPSTSRFEKIGTGTLTLTNTSPGDTGALITAGTLQIGDGGNNGAFTGTIENNANLVFNHSSAITYSKVLSGTGTTTKKGTGTLTLSADNSFTGGFVVSEGTLRATTNASALGTGAATVTLAGGTLQLANNSALNFGRDTTVTANSSLVSNRTSNGAGVTHTLGTLSIGANTLSVTRGTGGVTFGATTLTGNAAFDGGANAKLTLGTIGETGAARSLTKSGSGTLSLGGASTYTGLTAIDAGTLALASDASLANTSAIRVGSGATFDVSAVSGGFTLGSGQTIEGSGSVNGLVTLASGAHLAPGDSTGSPLTFTSGLTLKTGAILDFELGTISDQLRISGGTLTGATGTGGLTLNIANSGGFIDGTYTLVDFSDATASGFDVTDFTLGTTVTGYTYALVLIALRRRRA